MRLASRRVEKAHDRFSEERVREITENRDFPHNNRMGFVVEDVIHTRRLFFALHLRKGSEKVDCGSSNNGSPDGKKNDR